MRFEPDLLLEVHFGRRLEALDCFLLLFAKELFDGVAHAVRFTGGLGFGLDPKPSVPAWGIANVFHASSHISYDELGREPSGAGAALSAEDDVPARQSPQPSLIIIAAFSCGVA